MFVYIDNWTNEIPSAIRENIKENRDGGGGVSYSILHETNDSIDVVVITSEPLFLDYGIEITENNFEDMYFKIRSKDVFLARELDIAWETAPNE